MSPNPAVLTWPGVAGGAPLTPLFTALVGSPTNATSYTFPNVPIGAASVNRTVIIATGGVGYAGDTNRIVSVTVNGLPAAIDAYSVCTDTGPYNAIARISVPTGDIASIVVVAAGTRLCLSACVWTVDSALTLASSNSRGTNAYAANPSATLTPPPNGFTISTISANMSSSSGPGTVREDAGLVDIWVTSYCYTTVAGMHAVVSPINYVGTCQASYGRA